MINRLRAVATAMLLALVTLSASADSAAAQPRADTAQVELMYGIRVPMKDGVTLSATIYKPKNQAAPLPVIFWMTPYIADLSHARGMYFARNGYVFAVVDTRGRGSSGGTFEPFANEWSDGPDLVRWFARQPWSNGKVGLWGGSYGGFYQWAIAKNRPAELVSMAPVASAHPGVDFPQLRNIFRSYAIQWLTYTSGAAPQANLFGDGSFWISKYGERFLQHKAFASLDTIVGNLTTYYQKWMQHPTEDAYWQAMTPTREEYAKLDLPVLTITGYFDGDQIGAMTYYRRHLAAAPPAARDRHYLILGPWDHPGTRTPVPSIGGLTFGAASVLDMNQLHREWYDWTIKSGPKPAFLKKRVAYWVMGAGPSDGEWKYADNLDAISDSTQTLYLDAADGGNDVLHSGKITTGRAPAGRKPGQWTYDPLDVRGYAIETKAPPADYYKMQAPVFNLFGNGLVYHTEPFAEATEISGYPKLTAYIEMDVPDTDFEVTLYEVLPDGSAIYLADDALRARYRESGSVAKLVTPGEVTRYRFEQFTFFSRVIGKGSRLRLVIRSINSLVWEKNYNSGGVVNRETGRDARTARVRLHNDSRYPSALELPVVRPGRNRAD